MPPARNRNFWIVTALVFAFWTFAPFIDRQVLFELVNGLCFAVTIGGLVTWAPHVALVFKDDPRTWPGGYYLILGTYLAVSALAGYFFTRVVFRSTGDISVLNWLFAAWMVWIISIGLFIQMTARGAVQGRIPSKGWIQTGIWVTVGVSIAILTHLITHARLLK